MNRSSNETALAHLRALLDGLVIAGPVILLCIIVIIIELENKNPNSIFMTIVIVSGTLLSFAKTWIEVRRTILEMRLTGYYSKKAVLAVEDSKKIAESKIFHAITDFFLLVGVLALLIFKFSVLNTLIITFFIGLNYLWVYKVCLKIKNAHA